MSLTELKTDVDDDHRLHLPDIIYSPDSLEHSAHFECIPMSSLLPGEPDTVGIRIGRSTEDSKEEAQYLFSDWSRHQLLALLGTREKWFSYVTLERQAEELNIRLHGLRNFNLRTARAVDEDFPVRFVRGIVSNVYADIPNTEIMEAVLAKMPNDAMALRYYSGLTDRAFYAYVMSPTPIMLPGTSFFAYPGAVVKNSDVGFTSLYIIPMLIPRKQGVPVVFEQQAVLKRIHRGKVDLSVKFHEAFEKCSLLWAELSKKLPHLAGKQYPNADAALEHMQRMLAGALATKEFALKCKNLYNAAPRTHTALDIFEVVSEVCASYDSRDDSYVVGAIAGAVLFKLLF